MISELYFKYIVYIHSYQQTKLKNHVKEKNYKDLTFKNQQHN